MHSDRPAASTENGEEQGSAILRFERLRIFEVMDANPNQKIAAVKISTLSMHYPLLIQCYRVDVDPLASRDDASELSLSAEGPPDLVDALRLASFAVLRNTLRRWYGRSNAASSNSLVVTQPRSWRDCIPLPLAPKTSPAYYLLDILNKDGFRPDSEKNP